MTRMTPPGTAGSSKTSNRGTEWFLGSFLSSGEDKYFPISTSGDVLGTTFKKTCWPSETRSASKCWLCNGQAATSELTKSSNRRRKYLRKDSVFAFIEGYAFQRSPRCDPPRTITRSKQIPSGLQQFITSHPKWLKLRQSLRAWSGRGRGEALVGHMFEGGVGSTWKARENT